MLHVNAHEALISRQESVSVGLEHGIKPDDKVITGYRCHPFAVMRGGSITGVLSELLGRQGGMSHGKGGSMHIFTPSFFGGNGIVGAQVPVGAGVAFAQKYMGHKNCTFALYGDGASNQGQVFEAFNMVQSLLPVIAYLADHIIRPNFGISLPSLSVKTTSMVWVPLPSVPLPTPSTSLVVTRFLAFRSVLFLSRLWITCDILPSPGQRNGHHRNSSSCPICPPMGCRGRERPSPPGIRHVSLWWSLVCIPVPDHYAHDSPYSCSMSDPGTTYRTREEVQRMRSTQDPIRGLQRCIEEWGLASEQELKALDKAAKAEVDTAVEEAKASPEPENKDLWTDIYYKGTEPPFMRGREREEVHYY